MTNRLSSVALSLILGTLFLGAATLTFSSCGIDFEELGARMIVEGLGLLRFNSAAPEGEQYRLENTAIQTPILTARRDRPSWQTTEIYESFCSGSSR